jgi:hypothetical protein
MGGQMPDADGKARSADSSSSYGYTPSAPPQHQYGTFGPPSGASGEFPQPAVGFPQPAPPPGMQHYPQPPPASYAVYPPPQQPYSIVAPYYTQGYQIAQGTEGPSRALRGAASRLIFFHRIDQRGCVLLTEESCVADSSCRSFQSPNPFAYLHYSVSSKFRCCPAQLSSCLSPVYLNLQFLLHPFPPSLLSCRPMALVLLIPN